MRTHMITWKSLWSYQKFAAHQCLCSIAARRIVSLITTYTQLVDLINTHHLKYITFTLLTIRPVDRMFPSVHNESVSINDYQAAFTSITWRSRVTGRPSWSSWRYLSPCGSSYPVVSSGLPSLYFLSAVILPSWTVILFSLLVSYKGLGY